jgi:hypothetical protein
MSIEYLSVFRHWAGKRERWSAAVCKQLLRLFLYTDTIGEEKIVKRDRNMIRKSAPRED